MSTYAKMSFKGKNLKGTFNASLNGKPFRLNPMAISLDYTVKTSQTPTIGGMVVQVFGVEMGDLTVSGSFGKGGWQEQAEFLTQMINLGNAQASPLGYHKAASPFRFVYPQRGYDFLVYLKSYSSKSGMAVDFQNANFAPDWQLTLFIDNDNTNGKLLKVAEDAYIERLNAGFGYAPNAYMGQISTAEVETFLAGQGFSNNIQGYINAVFADPSLVSNSVGSQTGSGGTTYTQVPSGGSNEQSAWNFFIAKGLAPNMVAGILGQWSVEDGSFNPNIIQGGAVAPANYTMVSGTGYGLAQWTDPGRQAGLAALAKAQNVPISDLGVQLNYTWKELTTNYASVLAALKTTTTAQAASNIMDSYEGFSTNTSGERATNAVAILAQYGGSSGK